MATFVAIFCTLLLLVAWRFDKAVSSCPPVRVLAYIGGFSYSLYLSHWLVIGVVSQVMKRLYAMTADTYWISALVQVLAAVAISRLFYAMAEQPFLQSRRAVSTVRISTPELVPATAPRQQPTYARAA